MRTSALIAKMRPFPELLRAMVKPLMPEEARWRPTPNDWSVLEIVSHLADEESQDFRARLDLLLRDPEAEWPPIDPAGWAVQRRYNERDLADTLDVFERERRTSIAWLESLDHPEWAAAKVHPRLGPLRAGDLLASWCAHDQLHLRQIAKRRFQLTERDAGEFSPGYAGGW